MVWQFESLNRLFVLQGVAKDSKIEFSQLNSPFASTHRTLYEMFGQAVTFKIKFVSSARLPILWEFSGKL